MKVPKSIWIFILAAAVGVMLQRNGIRICPVYHFFHIPCPGCGCTRALISLFKGNIAMSWNYNPLVILGLSCGLFALPFCKQIELWMKRHLAITIIITASLAVLLEIHNIHNPLLW